ncbi:hypothetical protein FHG87_004803 [Trinorchestia longiramus]|nr:hypothetical protein FHG87_004803 [Trinorchestia longiramus]
MQARLLLCMAVVCQAVAWPTRTNTLGGPAFEQVVGARANVLTSNFGRVENIDHTVRQVEPPPPTARFGSLFGRDDQVPPFGALLRDDANVHQREIPSQANARTELSSFDEQKQPPASRQPTYDQNNVRQENEAPGLRTPARPVPDRELPRFKVILLNKKDDDDDDDEEEDSRGDVNESRERGREKIVKRITRSKLTGGPLITVGGKGSIRVGPGTKYTFNSERSFSNNYQLSDHKRQEFFQETSDEFQNQFFSSKKSRRVVPTLDSGTEIKYMEVKQSDDLNHSLLYQNPSSVNNAGVDKIGELSIQTNVEKSIEGSVYSASKEILEEAKFQSAVEGNSRRFPHQSRNDGALRETPSLLDTDASFVVAVQPPVEPSYVAAAGETPVEQSYAAAAGEAPVEQSYAAAAGEAPVEQRYAAAAGEPAFEESYAVVIQPPVEQSYAATVVQRPLEYYVAATPHIQGDFIGVGAKSSVDFTAIAAKAPVDEAGKNIAEGFRSSRYTNLDLAAVDFDNIKQRSSDHKEYISVKDNDLSGEIEVYKLVGVAPSQAVRGGAATTYSAKIGPSVPIYAELDDADSYWIRHLAATAAKLRSRGAIPYSAGRSSVRPLKVRAETAVSGDNFAVILDD